MHVYKYVQISELNDHIINRKHTIENFFFEFRAIIGRNSLLNHIINNRLISNRLLSHCYCWRINITFDG